MERGKGAPNSVVKSSCTLTKIKGKIGLGYFIESNEQAELGKLDESNTQRDVPSE